MTMALMRAISIAAVGIALTGHAGAATLPGAARAGDTIAVPVGWNPSLTRAVLTVTITPAQGPPISYDTGDPRIRGVVHVFAAPESGVVAGSDTHQDLDAGWHTLVNIDLPGALPAGVAGVTISGPDGPVTAEPVATEVVPGTGQASTLFPAIARVEHATVSFRGPTVPHSIQVVLARASGIGQPAVLNPRGDLKNLVWTDDGLTITVLLTPTKGETPARLDDFTFYVSGGVTTLQVSSVKAYDVHGTRVPDVAAHLQ